MRHPSRTDAGAQATGAASSASGGTAAPGGSSLTALGGAAASTSATSAHVSSTATGTATSRAPVDLQNAVDAVHATFTMAVRQGQTQARIALSPPSLGTIRISLSQTSSGLVARVVADHPEALRLLQQNGAELRNSLQASGLQVVRLDIGAGGQNSNRPGGSSETTAQAGTRGDGTEETDDDEQSAALATSPASGSGALVDVMA
jgi:flagellar hook-length control protein FliK